MTYTYDIYSWHVRQHLKSSSSFNPCGDSVFFFFSPSLASHFKIRWSRLPLSYCSSFRHYLESTDQKLNVWFIYLFICYMEKLDTVPYCFCVLCSVFRVFNFQQPTSFPGRIHQATRTFQQFKCWALTLLMHNAVEKEQLTKRVSLNLNLKSSKTTSTTMKCQHVT